MITKYNFPFVKKFAKKKVVKDLEIASASLVDKLSTVEFSSLNISGYNENYLKNYLKSIRGHIQRYSYLLCLALSGKNKPYKDVVLIDHGGGCGIMSFLAKELGIGKVIYNDIYDVSCNDVKILSDHLGKPIDHIIHGGIEDLILFSEKLNDSIDALVSYDVIEHIYDIYGFFEKLKFFRKPNFIFALGSGANPKNTKIVKNLESLQMQVEFESRVITSSHKLRDSVEPYYEIRKKIIKSYNNNLDTKEIETLAYQTRGLIKDDIIDYVKYYKSEDFKSRSPNGQNTCDPITGNWAEHLLDFDKITKITRKNNFQVKIMPGFLPFSFLFLRRIKRNFLNIIWSLFPNLGLSYSPFYLVFGKSNFK